MDDSVSLEIGVPGDIVVGTVKEIGVPPATLESGDERAGAEFWQLARAKKDAARIKQAALDSIDLELAGYSMGESLTKLRKSSTMKST
jgi:hypothetical protein